LEPATAGPPALSDPGVLSAAASSFAGSTHLPLPGVTDMIEAHAMQHPTDILGSCAAGSATSSVTSQITVNAEASMNRSGSATV